MKKALLLTSFKPGIHAFTPEVKEAFCQALDCFDNIEIAQSALLVDMTREQLAHYDALVLFSAPLGQLGKKADIAALLVDYLAGGGGIMVVHYACTGEIDELAQVVGARFRMHPAYNHYRIFPGAHEHYTLEGLTPFQVQDEMHQVYIDPFLPRQVLLRCLNDEGARRGNAYPSTLDLYAKNSGVWVDSAWCHEFLDGRVVYTVPGHDAQSLIQPQYRDFLSRCARWLMRADEPILRQTWLAQINPGQDAAFEAHFHALPPAMIQALRGYGVKNASVWRVGDLAFGYWEVPAGRPSLAQMGGKALETWAASLDQLVHTIAYPGQMRLMYQNLGLVYRDKNAIRHRVFATRLKPGCAEEYRRRHAALEDKILLNQKGKESNFTIWNKDEYIFGYCEMVKELDYPPTPAQQAASIAWEKKQLEIMDWLTDDADAITGQSHGKAIRIFP